LRLVAEVGQRVEDSFGRASVLSWVRVSRAELDVQLWRAVTDWLAAEWPFERVAYAARADGA
jgi:hypothetical protein